jgi:hypothetical protein
MYPVPCDAIEEGTDRECGKQAVQFFRYVNEGEAVAFCERHKFEHMDSELTQAECWALKTPRCSDCGAVPVCIGWLYPENGDSSRGTYACSEHCDHDCCAGVAERKAEAARQAG